MSKILYAFDDNKNTNYKYNISEDTITYHFSINASSNVEINLIKSGITLYYYYGNINYDDNTFKIKVNHLKNNTHSELFNHGVNVFNNSLNYYVDGVVLKECSKCICNQENQIINIRNGKSTICPNLLIDNFDVDSNHSAYIGSFRDDILFYMMSRGISRQVAIRLLLYGFLVNGNDDNASKFDKFINEINNI